MGGADGDGTRAYDSGGGERVCHAGVHDVSPFGGGEVKGGVGRGFAIDSRGGAFDVVRGVDGPMELLCLGGLPMRANEGVIEL